MTGKRRICVVTGSRAEYGLLYWVMKRLAEDNSCQLQLIVTGMHLSPEFGLTYKEIEKDGFQIDKKIEIVTSSDSSVGICKSMGLGLISFSEALAELHPDILLVLGDRYEIFSVASAAMISRVPIAHCHGGEATEGSIDEPIRHSITKMSHIHFTATDEYRKRVIQLGEHPESAFNVGALGIENINRLRLMELHELEESLDFRFGEGLTVLVTFHPVTLENASAGTQFEELVSALSETNARVIFTKSNSDTDGRIINDRIDAYVRAHPGSSIAFHSLGQLRYLSAVKHADMVIGNSSSGLIEVPSFKKPSINIGDRQLGRVRANSVIDCLPVRSEIIAAIRTATSAEFKNMLSSVVNPYGQENASEKILPILKSIDLSNILKKQFYDIG